MIFWKSRKSSDFAGSRKARLNGISKGCNIKAPMTYIETFMVCGWGAVVFRPVQSSRLSDGNASPSPQTLSGSFPPSSQMPHLAVGITSLKGTRVLHWGAVTELLLRGFPSLHHRIHHPY
jgi:hypothetical protein